MWKQECTGGQILIQRQERSSHSQKAPAERLASGSCTGGRSSTTIFAAELWRRSTLINMDGGGDLEFAVSGTYAGLSLKNNAGASTDRQVVFIGSGTQNFRMIRLGSRNISIHSFNFTVNLIDPLGYIPVSPQGVKGTANTYRTFKSLPFDPKAGAPISVKCYLRNTDTNTTLIDGYSDQINAELLVRRRRFYIGATETATTEFSESAT